MKALNKKVAKKFAYVKNNVIFDIKSYDNGDACAVEMTEENVPSVTVNDEKLFFDSYIEDGDVYTEEEKFKKTIHSDNEEEDEEKTYQDYYRTLCEDEIAKCIISNYAFGYNDFLNNLSWFGIPTWMFLQDPAVVNGIDRINFTEEYYNNIKETKVEELVYESAKKTANTYGYKLITPSKAEDLVIEKKD